MVLAITSLLALPAIAEPGMPPGPPPDGQFGSAPPGGDMNQVSATGVYQQQGNNISQQSETYKASQPDQSAIYVYGAGSYTLSDGDLSKSGDSSNVNASNFYGNNAIVLASEGSHIGLNDCSLQSDAEGANALLAYGKGTTINVTNCTIATTKGASRGAHATFGGSITISNSIISTQGPHGAALATDRGGGTVNATDVTGTTQGDGSPGIYSTGIITVNGGDYTAYGAEAAVIEGKNTMNLYGTDISGYRKRGVMIYQSNSGDSSTGEGHFQMVEGSLVNNSKGPAFFVTNTTATISLNDVDIINNSDTLLRAATPGKNEPDTLPQWGHLGGTVTFDATHQTLAGNIIADKNSAISLNLYDTSTLHGAINNSMQGKVDLTLDNSSQWRADGNSHLNTIYGAELQGSVLANIDAPAGVTIYYAKMTNASGSMLMGNYTLASGGKLVMD